MILHFEDEQGTLKAYNENNELVATGDEAKQLYDGHQVFLKQLAHEKTGGSILTRTIKDNILQRRVKPWQR